MDIQKLIEDFKTKNILVIGDLILDIYLSGKVDRISPEAPIPIVNHQHTKHALGGAANVAANIRGLGAQVTVLAILGVDGEGEYLETMLELEDIHHVLIKMESRTTTSKTRVIAGNHQLLRIDHERTDDINEDQEQEILKSLTTLLQTHSFDALVLEDYNKGFLTKNLIKGIIKQAETARIPVIVDPKKLNFFEYSGCQVFKPNLKEIAPQVPFKMDINLDSLIQADAYIRKQLNHKISMITLAEHGIFISDGQTYHLVPTQVQQVSDVSGAGDTVTAIATFATVQSLSLLEMATLSNKAAGYVCGIPGVHALQSDELIQLL